MPEIHNKRVYEIYKADDDEKGQIIMLPETSLLAPPSTVYQGDNFRYYKANSDWSRVIEGFLTWLAESPAWKNAEHEGFDAIQQILIFLEGITVIENCDDVNDCIISSPTIINIQNDITNVTNDITNVSNTVTNNTTEITNINEQVTNIEENSTYNVFPPKPTKTEDPDETCGSAYAIANYLNDLIQDVIVDAQTITFSEFVTAILGLGGFNASILKVLWDFIIANINPNLSSEVSSVIDKVAEHFYCNNLIIDGAKSDIIDDGSITADAEAAYIAAIDSLTAAKYSELIYLGSLSPSSACSEWCPETWEYVIDYTTGSLDMTTINKGSQPNDGRGIIYVYGDNPIGSGDDRSLFFLVNTPDGITCDVVVEYDRTLGTNAIGASTRVGNIGNDSAYFDGGYVAGDMIEIVLNDITFDNLTVFLRCSFNDTGTCSVNKITFSGEGVNPFI